MSDDPYTAIAQSNVGHGNENMNDAWDKAILADSSLTPQQFIKEWSAADSDKNGYHSKDELVNHLNSAKMNQEKGEDFIAKYWPSNWNKPKYKNGKWVKT